MPSCQNVVALVVVGAHRSFMESWGGYWVGGNKRGVIYTENGFVCWQSAFGSQGLYFQPAEQFWVEPWMSVHIHSLACAKWAHMCDFQHMRVSVHFISPHMYMHEFHTYDVHSICTAKGKSSRVVDFEGVLKAALLAVVNLQCGCRCVIAL